MTSPAKTTKIASLAARVLDGQNINRDDALFLLRITGDDLYDLFYWANRIRLQRYGRQINLCGIASVRTGLCPEDCHFCAQSARYASGVTPQTLDNTQILAAADRAITAGANCFGLVSSGCRPDDDFIEQLAPLIAHVATNRRARCCASLGSLSDSQARRLRDLGITRYHHNLETSLRFFPQVVTTHTYESRLATVRAAKSAGLETCSGGIIGLGESLQDRVDLAFTLRQLDVDSVPVNFLNPIPGTPFEKNPLLPPLAALQTIALFRFVLPDKEIKVAGGRESTLRDLQSWMFFAGASGCMIGDYLTTQGRPLQQDLQLLADLALFSGPENYLS